MGKRQGAHESGGPDVNPQSAMTSPRLDIRELSASAPNALITLDGGIPGSLNKEMQTYQAVLLGVGLTPIAILVAAGLLVGIIMALRRFSQDDLVEIGGGLAIVAAVSLAVSVFVGITCAAIQPVEQFVDISGDPLKTLLDGISDTEQKVCDLITRVDKFIESNLGKKGHDDPSLVVAARAAARPADPITTCPIAPFSSDVSDSVILADAGNRITRLETTLSGLTGPQLQKTYNRTVPCPAVENFTDMAGPTIESLQARLDAVRATLIDQQTKLLKPIDDKNERIQRHELSDCEKREGSKTAIKASNVASKDVPST